MTQSTGDQGHVGPLTFVALSIVRVLARVLRIRLAVADSELQRRVTILAPGDPITRTTDRRAGTYVRCVGGHVSQDILQGGAVAGARLGRRAGNEYLTVCQQQEVGESAAHTRRDTNGSIG